MIRTHSKSQREWEQKMAKEVLQFVQNEIYLDLRFFDVALSTLVWKEDDSIKTMATDGTYLLYPREHLLAVFQENSGFLNRLYLHSVFHCLFAHLWLGGKRNPALWHMACDIAVEYTIDHLNKDCLRRPISYVRQRIYKELENQGEGISAAVIYRLLVTRSDYNYQNLQREFYTDSHKYWPKQEEISVAPTASQKQWDKISRQTQMEMDQKGQEQAGGAGSLRVQLTAERSRNSYRQFLRKFAVLREEMHSNPEEFDMNYYSYGLQVYGNMPLIEPLETRETMKIQEFVVVVDTSYSTSGNLVKNFLQETFTLLRQTDSFFKRCQVRIIQCDDAVRSEQLVTSPEEMERAIKQFTITGGGGTDFRPAFQYVHERIISGEIKDLSGLLYFTDGKGIYPKRRPDYKTAFLFLQDYPKETVPPWAITLRLEPEEFLTSTGGNYGHQESKRRN